MIRPAKVFGDRRTHIPFEIAAKHGIKNGDLVLFVDTDDGIKIYSQQEYMKNTGVKIPRC